jgi:hypothetical protein
LGIIPEIIRFIARAETSNLRGFTESSRLVQGCKHWGRIPLRQLHREASWPRRAVPSVRGPGSPVRASKRPEDTLAKAGGTTYAPSSCEWGVVIFYGIEQSMLNQEIITWIDWRCSDVRHKTFS